MGVFYILLIIPMIIQHVSIKGYYSDYLKRNRNALMFFFAWLTFLIAFRHERVGNDTRSYIHFYEQFALMDWSELERGDLEIGYAIFNKTISLISKDSRFFLTIAAIVVSVMIYSTYRRLYTDTSLTIVLFCILSTFGMMFSGIRQMLSIGMGFLAYEFARSKKIFPFVVIVLLAISIHTSAFMLAFMYPLYHARITKKWLFVVVPILGVVFALNEPIFAVLGGILEQYTKYDTEISNTGAYTMLILFTLFAVISFLFPSEEKLDAETIGMRNFLLLAVAIQMFAPLHVLAMRMNYYYIIFIPILIPKIIEARSECWNQVARLARNVMLVFFLLYFFMNASTGGSLHVFPYHFFWENVT